MELGDVITLWKNLAWGPGDVNILSWKDLAWGPGDMNILFWKNLAQGQDDGNTLSWKFCKDTDTWHCTQVFVYAHPTSHTPVRAATEVSQVPRSSGSKYRCTEITLQSLQKRNLMKWEWNEMKGFIESSHPTVFLFVLPRELVDSSLLVCCVVQQ